MNLHRINLMLTCLLATSIGLVGCAKNAVPQPETAQADHSGHDHGNETGVHDHSGWWCAEHGVPESECSQCNSKVAGDLQKQGDWCKEHDRADSQCFICNPKAKEKFSAMYKAKYGKEPPAMEEESTEQEAKPKS